MPLAAPLARRKPELIIDVTEHPYRTPSAPTKPALTFRWRTARSTMWYPFMILHMSVGAFLLYEVLGSAFNRTQRTPESFLVSAHTPRGRTEIARTWSEAEAEEIRERLAAYLEAELQETA